MKLFDATPEAAVLQYVSTIRHDMLYSNRRTGRMVMRHDLLKTAQQRKI